MLKTSMGFQTNSTGSEECVAFFGPFTRDFVPDFLRVVTWVDDVSDGVSNWSVTRARLSPDVAFRHSSPQSALHVASGGERILDGRGLSLPCPGLGFSCEWTVWLPGDDWEGWHLFVLQTAFIALGGMASVAPRR